MSSERQKEYSKYLQSKEWKERRDKFRNLWGNKCACCDKTDNLHIHHLSYENLGKEGLYDLILLCKGCHLNIHKGKLRVWFFTKEEYKNYQKIKNIITDELCDYITFIKQ